MTVAVFVIKYLNITSFESKQSGITIQHIFADVMIGK